jgi:hypothetical protein
LSFAWPTISRSRLDSCWFRAKWCECCYGICWRNRLRTVPRSRSSNDTRRHWCCAGHHDGMSIGSCSRDRCRICIRMGSVVTRRLRGTCCIYWRRSREIGAHESYKRTKHEAAVRMSHDVKKTYSREFPLNSSAPPPYEIGPSYSFLKVPTG